MTKEQLYFSLVDLLVEFDEYSFAPTITMPNAEEKAIEWKKELLEVVKGYSLLLEAYVKRLLAHYPHSNSVVNTICKVAKEFDVEVEL